MSKYLVSTTEVYRVDSEPEVENFIAEAKADDTYELTKYNCEYKELKSKGEVYDTYYKVTLTKAFNDIKEPGCQVDISYEVN
jgi:hypothetical protein